MAECPALQLAVICDKVDIDQVGYIKGRRVWTLLSLIDDIMDQQNILNKPGLLVKIDYFHFFDCISKELMITASEKKNGVGVDFVNWVCV